MNSSQIHCIYEVVRGTEAISRHLELCRQHNYIRDGFMRRNCTGWACPCPSPKIPWQSSLESFPSATLEAAGKSEAAPLPPRRAAGATSSALGTTKRSANGAFHAEKLHVQAVPFVQIHVRQEIVAKSTRDSHLAVDIECKRVLDIKY